MAFAAFSTLWTSLPFLLARPPFGYSDSIIGSLGLLGASGAGCTSFTGHLNDRGHSGSGSFIALGIAAFVLMGLFSDSLTAVILGVVLVDLGVQGTQILNQSAIYRLQPATRSRITTAYMTCDFFGGAAGSAAAAYLFNLAGWSGVTMLRAGFGVLALSFWLTESRVAAVTD